MNEILTLAGVNLIAITASLLWEYTHVVHQRKVFDQQISKFETSDRRTTVNHLVFFPGFLQKVFGNIVVQKKGKVNETRKSFLNQITPVNLLLANVALVIIAFNFQTLFRIPWYVILFIFAIGEGFVYLYFRNKQIQVREAIEKKLPEILDMMARVYRVHSDLRISIKEVAIHSSDDIVKKQFEHVSQLSRFGYSVEDALEYLAQEVKSPDLDFVVSSIRLNAPVGGNLANLFEHTAQMLRQRKEATDEINNLMFQSKISATISAFLVPVITIVSFISSPKYQDALLRNPTGRMVFFFCLIWWFIGVVIIRKNSRIAL